MGTPDTPTSPKDVELTSVNSARTDEQQKVHVNITFCTHVGWDGALVLFFLLGIAGLFVYITFLYTKSFQAWHRPWVWLFLVLAVLYSLLSFLYFFAWKRHAKYVVEQSRTTKPKRRGARSVCRTIQRYKRDFDIKGSLFLWKLYFTEFVESINQLVNVNTFYLCTLPVSVTVSMCMVLSLDAFYRAYQLNQHYTVERRDWQIKTDLCIDFLCVALPLCVLWFGYQIPISVQEMIQITFWPSLCLFSKSRSIFREIVRVRTENTMGLSVTDGKRIAKIQRGRVPKVVSKAFCIYNVGYGLFLFSVAVAHLGMSLETENFANCDKTTWEKGCVNKIPFCKSLFKPTCNCASMKIENDYKLLALPNSLVDRMTGLRKVFIRNCNLTTLPPKMEKLTQIVDFEISFNRLQEFDVDVREWKKLHKLHLFHNNISTYNRIALWTHIKIEYLDISDNTGMEIPSSETKITMPSLVLLAFNNNSVGVNFQLDKKMFPNIMYLYLNGNNGMAFPDKSLMGTLQYLGVARCNLKKLPSYLVAFKHLKYLDARDNNISSVSNDLKALITRNQVESYFSGNMVCNTDKELDCKPVCSKYCWSRHVADDGVCHWMCNSKECKFDGGDCS